MRINRWFSLFGFLILVFLIAWMGQRMTLESLKDWYLTLKIPAWTPPSWVFGPVWTILYITIAISGWLVWIKHRPSKIRRFSFFIYGAQLLANLFWTYFFFFLKSPFLALIDIVILIFLIAINTILFTRLYRPAGYLLIPYLIWTLYAFSLNLAIWIINR